MSNKRKKQIEEMMGMILESKYFEDEDVAFIDNFNCQISYRPMPVRNEPLLYLSKAIDAMAYCDCVFFGNGWDKARGCCIERNVATHYHIPIVNCSSIEHLKKVKQMLDTYEESMKGDKDA